MIVELVNVLMEVGVCLCIPIELSFGQWTTVKKLVGTGTGYFRIKVWDGLNGETVSETRMLLVKWFGVMNLEFTPTRTLPRQEGGIFS